MPGTDLADLLASRLAARTLGRTGRPRGLTFDDHLVRGALVVDLALLGILQPTDDAVEVDHARAATHGLEELAALVDRGEDTLLNWVDDGSWGLTTWADHLVAIGAWEERPRRPWRPGRAWRPLHHGEEAVPLTGPAATALQELTRISGLGGGPQAPEAGLSVVPIPTAADLARAGHAGWALDLVGGHLVELRRSMRSTGWAVQ